jgi:menaquinone reductase, multiheme cytochrome c subunit
MNTPDFNAEVDPALDSAHGRPGRSFGWTIFSCFMIGLLGSLIVGWFLFPRWLYSQKSQPIDFNHLLHMENVSDGCNSCHYFREDGTFSGIPDLSACTDCHQGVMGSDTEEEKFVTEYVEKDRQVPWLSYFQQPDCVFFSHAAHVVKAGMKCESCHGDIGYSTHAKVYQQNRLSGYSRDIWGYSISRLGAPGEHDARPMKMNDCAKCHMKETGSKGACFQCHK